MRVLMLMAHPDDETIFGWPILQRGADYEASVLVLADNSGKRGEGPIRALHEVCRRNNAYLIDLPRLDNNFYRLPPRYAGFCLPDAVAMFRANIEKALALSRAEAVFSHNFVGEYGHGDHRMACALASELDVPILMTDICLANRCHLSRDSMPPLLLRRIYRPANIIADCSLDRAWYGEMRRVYERHKAWSWGGHQPVTTCRLFRL